MKYILLVTALVSHFLTAQKIVFADAAFKSKLLTSTINNNVARNLSDDYFAIDSNKNGEIEIEEAAKVAHLELDNSLISSLIGIENFKNLISLKCSNNQINSLNISALVKLTDLDCNSNSIATLTLTGATDLQNLYCQSNNLETLDASNLTNLITVECSGNKLNSLRLAGLNNLESLFCTNNLLTTLNLNNLNSLTTLECGSNDLKSIDLIGLVNLEYINCNYNQLTTLDISSLLNLKSLDCTNNQMTDINVDGLAQLASLNCNNNMLKTLNINSLSSLTFMYCKNNVLESINVAGLSKLKVLDFARNKIKNIDLLGLSSLISLFCSNNFLTELDITNQLSFQSLDVANNLITNLYIKNGSNESNGFLQLRGNPGLKYICADDEEVDFVLGELSNIGFTGCEVNSYCSFLPGGKYNAIENTIKLDSNLNGCNDSDINFPYSKLVINNNDAATRTTIFSDSSGFYSTGVYDGSYTVTPVVENPSYYKVSPTRSTLSYPITSNTAPINFCIAPNGSHNDLEIIFVPLDNAQSNFESNYKIIYKNKGTIIKSGSLNLIFDNVALNVITATPVHTSQSTGVLNWNFTNLLPQETRTILTTFKINSGLSNGQLLRFKASIANTNDVYPLDNISDLDQFIGNISTKNDKICLEGNAISSAKVGGYLHYIIRFENSGIADARNIVIKDFIDISKFDITTLVPIDGSHYFTTKITNNNTVEFVFENINLPFNQGQNTGYVVFKIKTLARLLNGAVISNAANIYFGFNAPILTKTVSTNIQNLSIQNHSLSDLITIYPNPVKNILNIDSNKQLQISAINIYNMQGQLVQTQLNSEGNINSINVSELKSGLYLIRIITESGSTSSKFLKE